MKYLIAARNTWWGSLNFQIADGEGNDVFRIALDKKLRRWTLQDTFGNPLTVIRRPSRWRDTFEIERVGEVIATLQRARPLRRNPRFEVLLSTGTRLLVSSNLNGQKYEVRSIEGQPFCRVKIRGTRRHTAEVETGADLVLAFSVIACLIQRVWSSPTP